MTHVGKLAGLVLGGLLVTWWTEADNFALTTAHALVAATALRLERRSRQATTGAQNVEA